MKSDPFIWMYFLLVLNWFKFNGIVRQGAPLNLVGIGGSMIRRKYNSTQILLHCLLKCCGMGGISLCVALCTPSREKMTKNYHICAECVS
jgi:hypothetical protein